MTYQPGDPKFDPLRRPGAKDGETPPPPQSVDAFYAGHRMRIERRKERETNSQKIFGRQNVGRVTAR